MVPPHVADEKLWSMGVFYKSKKGRSHCNTEQISTRLESVKVAVQTPDTSEQPQPTEPRPRGRSIDRKGRFAGKF